MKDNYKKPTIYFEDFELSQSIAANCTYIIESNGSATEPESDFNIYAEFPTCKSTLPNTDDKYCYHAPISGFNVYSS